MGVSEGDATAADLVWRAASFVPQIVIGIVALATWYRRAARKFAAARRRRDGRRDVPCSRQVRPTSREAPGQEAAIAGGCQPPPDTMSLIAEGCGAKSRQVTSKPCPGGVGSQLAACAGSLGCAACR